MEYSSQFADDNSIKRKIFEMDYMAYTQRHTMNVPKWMVQVPCSTQYNSERFKGVKDKITTNLLNVVYSYNANERCIQMLEIFRTNIIITQTQDTK